MKKRKKGHDEIIEQVSQDTGYSEDLVRFVLDDFYESLHWWLTNPLACGKKIIIENAFKFYPRPYYVGKDIGYTERNDRGLGPEYQEARIYYLNKVLEQIASDEKKQRQAQFGIEYARRSGKTWQDRYEKWEKEEAVYPWLRDYRRHHDPFRRGREEQE